MASRGKAGYAERNLIGESSPHSGKRGRKQFKKIFKSCISSAFTNYEVRIFFEHSRMHKNMCFSPLLHFLSGKREILISPV